MITIGRLKDRVSIEREERVANGQGGFTTSWTVVKTVFAEVIGISGNEALIASVPRAVTQWRVTLRKQVEVDERSRLQWGGRVLAVKSVMPHSKDPDQFLLLVCESGSGS